MVDLVLACVIPFLVMVIITRISFSLLGACIVTWMINIVVLGFHNHWLTLIVALLSFFAGLVVARKRLKRKPGM